ncbi:MAG: sigma-54-dependent Fis family transcriptional regulator [Archangium gephyra]|uniref:Sigma-54-dependent Fis family transcriptional regulator n=1 Tax=Archangium gephyra TaxID=48 RepID=A0A2W5T5X9_9BACT|nr:MAG: sigma-54-dependent Fis family transcriptional regulator [Archangium gephyra]
MKHQVSERSNRRPFHVRVVTVPAISRCWSVNLSLVGIGLIGSPRHNEGPREGEPLELEVRLPGDDTPLRARGEVRWRHDARSSDERASSAFGVAFTGFEDDGRVRLARYLDGPPVRVAVAFADPGVRRAIEMSLEGTVQIEFGDDDATLSAILARGDVSALAICGDEHRASRLAQRVASVTEENLTLEGRPRDLAARVVYCTSGDPRVIATLFNERKLHRWLSPPFTGEQLREAVMDACTAHALRVEQERMAQELERNLQRERALRAGPAPIPVEQGPGFRSEAMQAVLEQVKSVAPYKVSVLLQGETGTGKEVLARIVHRMSDRRSAPIVVQDCGTLTETLLESELFGHVRGAFTGAVADHPGLFVLADGGTVFLDEIENTSPSLQAKLLRVLETGEVRPVGGTQTRRVDVRLITASNVNLLREVSNGKFRADLYYRLNTFPIELPPLRERGDDVLALARHFLVTFNHQHRKSVLGLALETERLLVAAAWPGNVRELRNVIERAVLLCPSGETVAPAHLPPALRQASASPNALHEKLADTERQTLESALRRHAGVARRAALDLGMDPVTFARRARKLNIEVRSKR